MQIFLKLGRHCIETACKRKYEHLIAQYFKACDKERADMEPVINALKFFLENADFSDLRNRMGKKGSNAMAVMQVPDFKFDRMYVRFGGTCFYPVWKDCIRA